MLVPTPIARPETAVPTDLLAQARKASIHNIHRAIRTETQRQHPVLAELQNSNSGKPNFTTCELFCAHQIFRSAFQCLDIVEGSRCRSDAAVNILGRIELEHLWFNHLKDSDC